MQLKGGPGGDRQRDRLHRLFGEPFWSHLGSPGAANRSPWEAQGDQKSSKIASKFEVDFGMQLGTPENRKMEPLGRPRQPKGSQNEAKTEPKCSPKGHESARSLICKKRTENGGLSMFYRFEAAKQDAFWKEI